MSININNTFIGNNLNEATQNELLSQNVDERIETWEKIADREKVDITDEKSALTNSNVGPNESLVEFKNRICSDIVKKVKNNIIRVPVEGVIQLNNQKLLHIMNIMSRWIEKAKEMKIDINEEIEIINEAEKNANEYLDEINSTTNPVHSAEVLQQRLITLRRHFGSKIITKIYFKKIADIVNLNIRRNWLDDTIIEVIEGIANDAFFALMQPWNRKNQEEREQEVLELQEKHDQEVFQLFEANIKLFSENPNKYAELADREWLKREVSRISEDLIRQCNHRAPNLIPEIRLTQQLVIQQLEKGVKTEELKEVVDNVFQSFAERIAAASKRRNTETYYYPSGPNSGNQGSPN